ncbi:MAG: hypothetical protein RRZ70_00100 [Synergistaceae bacterium]
MNRIKKITISILISFSVILLLTSQLLAWDTTTEVRRLNKEAPSIDGYSKAKALIWLRDNDYKMLADGTMQHTKYTVVMMGEEIPLEWEEIKLPVPDSGTVEINEAAIYNPMTGLKEENLAITDETLDGGATAKVIKVSEKAIGRAVVFVVRTTYPKHYGIDSTIKMASNLPIWEQKVTAELPEGKEIYWTGKEIKTPTIIKKSGVQKYTWTVMNQPAWTGEGFVVYKLPSLTFSSKKGVNEGLRDMETLVKSVPSIPLPIVSKGSSEKTAKNLMDWLSAPERQLNGYPQDWIRSAEQIPTKGPWTKWEQTLLLNKWLKTLGWESEVWWQADGEITKESPLSTSTWISPVLMTGPGNGKKEIYQAGQTTDYGIISPTISGTHIYALKNGEFTKKKVSDGKASYNRLYFAWRLALDDNGKATGKLSLLVTGGWIELFSKGTIPTKEQVTQLVKHKVNFAIPGMSLEPESVKTIPSGYKIDFDVKCNPGIILAGNLLLRLPGGVPSSVGEMVGKNDDYTLNYPFTIEQTVKVDMPKGYRLLQTPPVKNIGEGSKATLKETIIHWPKKAQLIAESRWIVKTTDIKAPLSNALKEELNALLRWPVIDLPFVKK